MYCAEYTEKTILPVTWRTGEMAEMRPASLELGIGSSVVLDGRTAGMSESRSASDRCQRYVDVVVVCCSRRRHVVSHGRRGGGRAVVSGGVDTDGG